VSENERHPLPVIVEEEEGLLRREMLELVGAAMALAACEPPRGKILPYVRQPREIVPGQELSYATTLTDRGIAWGVIVRTRAGRPLKVDGNPDHPTTLGGGSAPQLQASLYDLYDPARLRGLRHGDAEIAWTDFYRALREDLRDGRGLHLLLEPTTSPLLVTQLERLRNALPAARIHFFDPLASAGEDEALRTAFGRPRQLRLRLDRAWAIAAFDADFLMDPPERIRFAHDFSQRRRALRPGERRSRLWVAEGDLTVTGAIADERMRIRPSAIPSLLASLVGELGQLAGEPALPRLPAPDWIRRLARDLWQNRGASAVIVGERQPAEAHLCGLLANRILGNLGNTVEVTAPVVFERGEESHRLESLVRALEGGEVRTLLILGGDPVRAAPADFGLARLMRRARRRIYLGTHANDTSALCDFVLAGLHPFEQWGDARAHDGTISLVQPVIRPLWGGWAPVEIVAALLGESSPSSEALLRQRYASIGLGPWQTALQWGFLQGSLPSLEATPDEGALRAAVGRAAGRQPSATIEISIRPDPKLRDGRFSRNGWLVELPDPITSLQWGNAALMSPSTAQRLGVDRGRVIRVQVGGEAILVPALPLRGMADDVVTLHLGWGGPGPAWAGGRPSREEAVGVDVFPLRRSDAPWIALQAEIEPAFRTIEPIGSREPLHATLVFQQSEFELHGRPILLSTTDAEFRADPDFVAHHDRPAPNVYGMPWTFEGPQWGMIVDLATCIGCAACVVACQAENNIPVVGKTNSRKHRSMHWLRIDRYYLGEGEEAQYLPQPMLCQHCEMAPCEYVCPVNATVHSPDGLNEMIYNRCIGTRFCSNNCPYKVRRFNYFRYNVPHEPETLKMMNNPEVTVRERGVMEKCTYCVQRIRAAQIEARIHGRTLRDGEVKTACQVACPTHAITFGLVSEPESEVARLRRTPRSYAVLNAELGTEPRTRYLAHLRNRREEEV